MQCWHLAAAKGFFGRLADLADRPMANGQNWQPKHDWEIGRGQNFIINGSNKRKSCERIKMSFT